MMISFFKDANQERKFLGLTLQPDHQRKKNYIKITQTNNLKLNRTKVWDINPREIASND